MEDVKETSPVDIKEKVKTYIIENFLLGDSSNNLNEEDSFFEKGIIDSTGILELVSFVQETFNIKIDDMELVPDNLDSLNNLEAFIIKKKQG